MTSPVDNQGCRGMTDAEYKVLEAYIRDMADRMGLRDWVVDLSKEYPGDDALASVNPTNCRKHAVVRISRYFWTECTSEEQRQTICHELTHLHLINAMDVIRKDLYMAHSISQDTYDVLYQSFKRQIEYGVDGIADEWSKVMPLIEWEKVKGKVE